jgi:hypothetical protein
MSLEFSETPSHKRFEFSSQTPKARSGYQFSRRIVRKTRARWRGYPSTVKIYFEWTILSTAVSDIHRPRAQIHRDSATPRGRGEPGA